MTWLLILLVLAFAAIVAWTFRPGGRRAQKAAAERIFRNEKAPRRTRTVMPSKREIDAATQTATTGHEWDGIKELDTPMPRWWLWTLYATIVWGVVYMILMPAWPLRHGATPGILGYSSRQQVAAEIDARDAANAPLEARLLQEDLSRIANDPDLQRFAIAGGAAVFRNNCAPCHGAGASGVVGHYPNLLDDDWLWGGTVDDVRQTVTHGIRDDADPDTRGSQMPAFAEILQPAEIDALTEYVLSLSGNTTDAALAATGHPLFLDNCASCHGEDGKGGRDFGAPNLTDGIWLYGGDAATIHATIANARYEVMPAFGSRLRPADIAKVAVYVHALGGGE